MDLATSFHEERKTMILTGWIVGFDTPHFCSATSSISWAGPGDLSMCDARNGSNKESVLRYEAEMGSLQITLL